MSNAPEALNMPCETYDDFFVGPWATEKQYETKHRELTESVGKTLKGTRLSSAKSR